MDAKNNWDRITVALARFAEYSNTGSNRQEDSEKLDTKKTRAVILKLKLRDLGVIRFHLKPVEMRLDTQ